MSADLKDFRGKITIETHCVVEALHRVSGDDRRVIVRQVLHEWAVKKVREAKITDALLKSEGMSGIVEGIAGHRREGGGK